MMYRLLRLLFRASLGAFFRRIEVRGSHHLRARGPVLIVANHVNALVDPLLILTRCRRRVTVTAKSTLRRNPLLAVVIRGLGAIEFHRAKDVAPASARSANRDAIEACVARLGAGGCVVVFPEGESHSEPRMHPFHGGAARIALAFTMRHPSTPLTVVPAAIHFERKERFRSTAGIVLGESIDVAAWCRAHPDGHPRALTSVMESRVRELVATEAMPREPTATLRDLAADAELIVAGAPIAAVGWINHIIPFALTRALVRRVSRDRDHVASNAVFMGIPVFLGLYGLQAAAVAAITGSMFVAIAYAILLPYTGLVTLLYRDRLGLARRRLRALVLQRRRRAATVERRGAPHSSGTHFHACE